MPVVFNPFTGNLDLIDNTAAAGSDTQVQFNDGGVLGGDSGLVFNKTTNALTGGAFIPNGSTVPANGLYLPAANSVALSTNGVQRINIEADGDINIDSGGVFYDATNNRLAIGTASAGSLLSLKPSSGGGLEIQDTGGTARAFATLTGNPDFAAKIKTSNYYLDLETAQASGGQGHIRFFTGVTTASERAAIDSSGRLLVGTSSDISGSSSNTSLQVVGSSNNLSGEIYLGRNDTGVLAGDEIGKIEWRNNDSDGTTWEAIAKISAEAEAAYNTGDKPGRLVFSTTADGASSPTERMRIKADGSANIGMGAGTFSSNVGVEMLPTGQLKANATSDVALHLNRGADNGDTVTFRRSQTLVGSISVTASATAYNTSSDYRLKENVTAVTDGITRLQQLKPSRFNFIADPDTTVDGFLAHEVQTIVPEAITGEKDAVDDEGNPVYQGIDQSKLVPLLTAALQEAIGEIESLKARVAALESA